MTNELELDSKPVAFMEGSFGLYNTPDGGIHVTYREIGTEEIQHVQIPGFIVRIAKEAQESGNVNPLTLMKAFRKGV